VLNIADAADALEAVVAEWNYRNLDEVAAFDVRCASALSGASGDGCCGLDLWGLPPRHVQDMLLYPLFLIPVHRERGQHTQNACCGDADHATRQSCS